MGRKSMDQEYRFSLRLTAGEKAMVDLAYKVDGVESSMNRFFVGILMDRCGEIMKERRWRVEEERRRLNGIKGDINTELE